MPAATTTRMRQRQVPTAYRRHLPELGEDMLYHDTPAFEQFVATVNRDYRDNMCVVAV